LKCLFDVRLHSDADGLRLQSRHVAFLCVKRLYYASIVQIGDQNVWPGTYSSYRLQSDRFGREVSTP
jgi:hypothetical protein